MVCGCREFAVGDRSLEEGGWRYQHSLRRVCCRLTSMTLHQAESEQVSSSEVRQLRIWRRRRRRKSKMLQQLRFWPSAVEPRFADASPKKAVTAVGLTSRLQYYIVPGYVYCTKKLFFYIITHCLTESITCIRCRRLDTPLDAADTTSYCPFTNRRLCQSSESHAPTKIAFREP